MLLLLLLLLKLLLLDNLQVQEKCTQTDWSFGVTASLHNDLSYAFSLTLSPECPFEYQKTMEERLEVKYDMLNNLTRKLGNLQKELDSSKEKEFRIEKVER